jgi:hypothetical protein
MPSIRSLLQYGEAKGILAKDYSWQKIYGAADIIEYGKKRKIVSEATVSGAPRQEYFNNYGQSYLGTTEGVLFSDRTLLVCATTSEFAGTFASHNDVVTNYYILKPLK